MNRPMTKQEWFEYLEKTWDAAQKEARAEQQEPVCEVYRFGNDSHGRQWHGIHWYDANVDVPTGTKLYTSPPKREWQGLTDDEKSDIWCVVTNRDFVTEDTHVYADAIEAKLKEKNHD